jgi:hypothetical protein
MSNIITPLTNVDFTACIEELKSHLELRIVAIPQAEPWSDLYYFMVTGEDLPETEAILAELNLSLVNILYIETQGGIEYYHGAPPLGCIILSLEELESRTINAYSAPLNSARLPEYPNGYNPGDCTLIQGHAGDEPVFLSGVLEDAELVYSFGIPEGAVYKSIAIFVNENTGQ